MCTLGMRRKFKFLELTSSQVMHICNPRNPTGKQETETGGSPDVLSLAKLRANIAANTLFLSATKWKARTDIQGCHLTYAYTMCITHTVTHECTQTLYTSYHVHKHPHCDMYMYTHTHYTHTHTSRIETSNNTKLWEGCWISGRLLLGTKWLSKVAFGHCSKNKSEFAERPPHEHS